MQLNQPPNPTQMLPPQMVASMVNRGADPTQLFQQNPLSSNMTPGAMGADPSTMPSPPPGSEANNPMMQPPAGTQPGSPSLPGQPAPMDESTMILQALQDRLEHHSKITEKTVSTLQKMVEAGLPASPDQGQSPAPTA